MPSFSVFPNPAPKRWVITCNPTADFKVELFDVQGRKLSEFATNSQELVIDASIYPPGNYFAHATSPAGSQILKLFRE